MPPGRNCTPAAHSTLRVCGRMPGSTIRRPACQPCDEGGPIDPAAMSSPAHAGDLVRSEHRVLSGCFLETPADTGWPACAGQDKRSVSEIPALPRCGQEIADHLK